ncbi:MAG TPA: hypothetical protein VL096_14485, partial [Pirellulaceae bacterium]|nr:hypothetical protein [Pirellulaceae bacterium]
GLGWKYANTSFWASLTDMSDAAVDQKGEIRREEATSSSQRNALSTVERVPTDSSELPLDADATEQRNSEVEVIDVVDANELTADDAEPTGKSLNTDANQATTAHDGEVRSDNQTRGTSQRVDAQLRRSMVSKRVGSPAVSAAERREREGGLIALATHPGDANGFTLSVGPVLAHALGESSSADNVTFVAVLPPATESDTASEPTSGLRINFATLTTVLVGGMLMVAARRYSQANKSESDQELAFEQRPLDQ